MKDDAAEPEWRVTRAESEPSDARLCVLVLGMHRSGTSAFTRTIALAGAELPKTLLGGNTSNRTGHWEPVALVRYHDAFLAELGSAWDDWRRFDLDAVSPDARARYKAGIARLVQDEFGSADLFVVKEPRICRFAPLFIEALREAGVEPRIVMPLRNPLEVAESLQRRSGLTQLAGALLWLRHVLDSEAATRGRPRAIVSFDRLLTDWNGVLTDIARRAELRWPRQSAEIAGELDEFLTVDERHHSRSEQEAQLDPALKHWAGASYSALRALERNEDTAAAHATLDAVRAEFDGAAPLLHRLWEGEKESANAQLERAESKAAELRNKLSRSAQQRDARKEQAVRYRQRIRALKARIGDINKLSRNEQAVRYRQRIRALEARIGGIYSSASRRAGAPLKWLSRKLGAVAGRVRQFKMAPTLLSNAHKAAAADKAWNGAAQANPKRGRASAEAQAATSAQDWPLALERWGNLLVRFPNKAEAKLNISVARRMLNLVAFRQEVAAYAAARAQRASAAEAGSPRIAVFTAISGGYDTLNLPETPDPRLDYILFTDTPASGGGMWQVRPLSYIHEDATRSARFVKTHPHWLLAEYDVAVWIDANIMIVGDIYPLVEDFLASGAAVAAIPHPARKTVREEAEACILLGKDDRASVEEHTARYRAMGFDCDDLIESNLMMFDLRHERTGPFFTCWWAEIDRYSKRDQLSVNYALKQTGAEWHRLTEPPNSARKHPALALVAHSNGSGASSALLKALAAPAIDPYAAPSYATVREARIAENRRRTIDIVVCVHNAYDDVRACLESVRRHRKGGNQRIVIVDDGSAAPTADYVREFAKSEAAVQLIRNDVAAGYTRAANMGLSISAGDLAIVLNSDTIVTDGWAEKMADAMFATPGAGIVGPLSNAASYQSIPDHRSSTRGQTAINDLPEGLTPDDMNRLCEEWTKADVLPRVPLAHGFCFGITRAARLTVGLFDETNFPRGYGEENDYCFRASDAGFGLVIATHTFVYHAKSKSFSGEDRIVLMKAGSESFVRLHGRARKTRAVRTMDAHPLLVQMRERTASFYNSGIRIEVA